MRKCFYILLIFGISLNAGSKNLDSLFSVLRTKSTADTNKFWNYFFIAQELNIGGDFEKSSHYLDSAELLAEKLNFKKGIARVLNGKAINAMQTARFDEAITYLHSSYKILLSLNDRRGEATALLNMGNIYFYLGESDQSLDYFRKSWSIYAALNDSAEVTTCYNNFAAIWAMKKNYDSAEFYFKKVILYLKHDSDPTHLAQVYMNMGAIQGDKKDFKKALEYSMQANAIFRKTGHLYDFTGTTAGIAAYYAAMGDYKKSIAYADTALAMTLKTGAHEQRINVYNQLINSHSKAGNYEKALFYKEAQMKLKDSVWNEQNSKATNEIKARFDSDKKQKDIELLSKDNSIRDLNLYRLENEINRKRWFIISAVAGILLCIGSLIFILKARKEKEKLQVSLEKSNEEITKDKKEIEHKNLQIEDSIEYAREIQRAVLPTANELKLFAAGHFLIYRPKDVVSGDFYWTGIAGNKKYVAVVDCTGHGVPGAFMSVLSLNMIENLLMEEGAVSPAILLDQLNKDLAQTLNRESERPVSKFGLDISLISLEKKEGGLVELEFAGAHHPILIKSGNEFKEIKGDKIFPGMSSEKFTAHRETLQKGTCVYLFTDGASDQFGGEKREKLFSSRFREWIREVSTHTMQEQGTLLQKKLEDWQGQQEQIDDVLVLGIEI